MKVFDDFLELGATVIDVFEHVKRGGRWRHDENGWCDLLGLVASSGDGLL